MTTRQTSRRAGRVTPAKKLRTAEQARKWLDANGISQAEFARSNGVPRMAVVDILRGRGRGIRGDHHIAAIALGMKAAPADTAPRSARAKGR